MGEGQTLSRRSRLTAAAGTAAVAAVVPETALSSGDPNISEIPFARIFSSLENKHYHHYLVERDTLPDSQHTAEVGYEYLWTLRAKRARKAGRRHA